MTLAAILITITLFLAYWIIGGALIASVSFIRNMKMNKARFSCLFTLTALFCAIGATYAGLLLSREDAEGCVEGASNVSDAVASFIGCSVLSLSIMAIAGFIALGLISMFLLLLSRSWNQSWMDDERPDDSDLEFSFENM